MSSQGPPWPVATELTVPSAPFLYYYSASTIVPIFSAEAAMCVVLVVDDDHSLRGLMVLMLTKLDCQPIGVSSGIDAERILAHLEPALVLVDIVMPRQDGYETCRHIRTNGYDGCILFISAQPVAPEKVRDCGADGFVQKPITMLSLVHQLNKIAVKHT
jgi:two-component system, OmpR family, response regulator